MFDEHDRFLAKNKMMAQAYEVSETEGKVKSKHGDAIPADRPMSCFNCKKKNRCLDFKAKSTGGSSGVVSIDSGTTFLCAQYDPMPLQKKERSLNNNQIRSMVKAAKSGRL
jgi:hypothetical protein